MRVIPMLMILTLNTYAFPQSLPGTIWGPEKGGFGFYLTFAQNSSFDFAYSGEGGGQKVTGTYEQQGTTLILIIEKRYLYGDMPDYLLKNGALICVVEKTDSVFSKYKMTSNAGFELFCLSYIPEAGEERTIDGMRVDAFFLGKGKKIKVNARLREGPGLQYEFYRFDYDDSSILFTSIPAGRTVIVFARSKNKEIIDGKENYWYYCRFSNTMWTIIHGWIWGELIEF